MRKEIVTLLFTALPLSFPACPGNDPLAGEIPEYHASIQPIISDLERLSKHFVKVYLDKGDVESIIGEIDALIIPRVKEIREEAMKISPKTMEVSSIHSLLIDSLTLRISAYSDMKKGFVEKDPQLFNSGLSKLNDSKLKEEAFFTKGKQIFSAYGYTLSYFPETMLKEGVESTERSEK